MCVFHAQLFYLFSFQFVSQPTNHLDADTVRALCEALSTFEVCNNELAFFCVLYFIFAIFYTAEAPNIRKNNL